MVLPQSPYHPRRSALFQNVTKGDILNIPSVARHMLRRGKPGKFTVSEPPVCRPTCSISPLSSSVHTIDAFSCVIHIVDIFELLHLSTLSLLVAYHCSLFVSDGVSYYRECRRAVRARRMHQSTKGREWTEA